MVDAWTVAFGVAGIAGAVASVLIAVRPELLHWYFDRVNRPLKIHPVSEIPRANPAFGSAIRFRVRNRLMTAVSVSFSPMTSATVGQDEKGGIRIYGTLFEDPICTIYPSGEPARFWLGGREEREVEFRLPVRQGVLQGREDVAPIVFANRFRVQQIQLGPYPIEIDPTNKGTVERPRRRPWT